MIVRIGDRIFSSHNMPISISLTDNEFISLLAIAEKPDYQTRSKEEYICIMVGPRKHFQQEPNVLEEWSAEIKMELLCNCNFCVCTLADKEKMASEIGI